MYKLSLVGPCKILIKAKNPEKFPQIQIKPHQQHNKQKLKTVVTVQRRSHHTWISSVEKKTCALINLKYKYYPWKSNPQTKLKKRFPMLQKALALEETTALLETEDL